MAGTRLDGRLRTRLLGCFAAQHDWPHRIDREHEPRGDSLVLASASRPGAERCRDHRPGARRRGRRDRSSATAAARSCRPTTPCSATTTSTATPTAASRLPLIVPGQRAGRRLHGRRLRARERQGRRRAGDVGPGRDQHRDAGARLHGRLDPDRRDLRPGADRARSAPTRSRKRRSSASWARCAKHVFLVTDPTQLEATMRTAFEIARTGRPGPVVVDVPKDVQNWIGRVPGLGHVADSAAIASASSAAADRRRSTTHDCSAFLRRCWREAKRPLIYAGGGVVHGNAAARAAPRSRGASAFRSSTTLMGIGAVDTTRPALDADARHARRGVRELRRRRLRLPDRGRRALRRPRGRGAGEVRAERASASRTSTSTRPRSARSSACDWRHVGVLARGLRALLAAWRRRRHRVATSPAGTATSPSSSTSTR